LTNAASAAASNVILSRAVNPVAGLARVIENSAVRSGRNGEMAERLDFEGLWPFELGRFGTSKGNAPCIMELVSFLKTGTLDEEPECVSEVLFDFIQPIHDAMPDEERKRLVRFIPRLIDSVDKKREAARAGFLAAEALAVWLPLALEAAGLFELANDFRDARGEIGVYSGLLRQAVEDTEDIPFLADAVDDAATTWASQDHAIGPATAASVVVSIINGNDPVARKLCLGLRAKEQDYGLVPGIYDAVINSIDGALALGKQGSELDPWVVTEAAERCRAFYGKKPPAAP
jgi:hypothetical protein